MLISVFPAVLGKLNTALKMLVAVTDSLYECYHRALSIMLNVFDTTFRELAQLSYSSDWFLLQLHSLFLLLATAGTEHGNF
jgi:hypothetical protein